MRILVINVAGETGGALSVMNRLVERFRTDRENEYIVCVSRLKRENCENVTFLRFPWVKKSSLHRMYFDTFHIKKLIKIYQPDRILSLQNKGVSAKGIPQTVYFHNALFICEKRFSFLESRRIWMYQHPIAFLTKRSLRRADKILVQAEWIKRGLVERWGLNADKIVIDAPKVAPLFGETCDVEQEPRNLFYPAAFYPYKNHITLLRACAALWDDGYSFTLSLTGSAERMSSEMKRLLSDKSYPITFLGSLSPEEMKREYARSILVFPSYIETVGLPLMEARVMNRPIFAADCEYAHESVGSYENITYFSPLDEAALREAIRRQLMGDGKGKESK